MKRKAKGPIHTALAMPPGKMLALARTTQSEKLERSEESGNGVRARAREREKRSARLRAWMLESPRGGGTTTGVVRWFARTRQAVHPPPRRGELSFGSPEPPSERACERDAHIRASMCVYVRELRYKLYGERERYVQRDSFSRGRSLGDFLSGGRMTVY